MNNKSVQKIIEINKRLISETINDSNEFSKTLHEIRELETFEKVNCKSTNIIYYKSNVAAFYLCLDCGNILLVDQTY